MDEWEVIDIKKNKKRATVYDIEVEDNHNFFADKVLSHNCHHLPARSLYEIAMKCHNSIMVGLSATPFRDDGEDMRMFAALGPIVYSITIRELIDQGYLADAEIHVEHFKHETPDIFSEYHDIVNIHVVNNEERNMRVCKIAYDAPKPCLILVDKIEHGENLSEMMSNLVEDTVPFIHGKSKERAKQLQALKDGVYKVAIASKIYNEGVDVPVLKSLVIAAGGKSSVKVTQQMGRVLRMCDGKTKAHIYDIFDNVKYLNRHAKARLDLYEKNFEVTRI